MENLHGNPLFIIEDADQPVIVLVKPEGLTGVCHVRFHKGAGIGVGLKITPECAPANPYPKAGKTRHGLLHSPLERLRVYRLSHKCREAIDCGVAFLLNGRIEYPCVVQGVPSIFFLFPGHRQGLLQKNCVFTNTL